MVCYDLFTFILDTLLCCDAVEKARQIRNFAEMSKSQSDGGLQFKFFLHVNGSPEYTNYLIEIPMEHFFGVS